MMRRGMLLFLLMVFYAESAFPGAKKIRPTLGEHPDSAATPNARTGPVPRNEEEINRSPPTGAEAYGLMKQVTDPETGEKHLVPVDSKTDPKDPPPK